MNLLATQSGTSKNIASSLNKIVVPALETFKIKSQTHKLDHADAIHTEPTEVFVLNGDSTFGKKYTKTSSTPEGDKFQYTEGTIKLPSDVQDDTEMFIMYEYEAQKAVEVVNSATKFPVGCRLIMEVLGCDVCDQTNLIYAYVIFDNFKLSPDIDWNIATDGVHPFSGKAQQAYCDKEKKLFSIVIPGEEGKKE